MVIETDRLILRKMTEDDFDALYVVLADSDIMQHYPYSFDKDRVSGWIRKNIERYKVFGFGLWAVVLKETGDMIGDCGLTMQIINEQIRPEIGYHIRKDCQRRGYASEAAKAVRDWTFMNTPFNIIYSYMMYTNVPSYRTAITYGCHLVDEFEDDTNKITKVYAISRAEWDELKRKNS
ncbi:GCN5 family acetyltransferase [Clostridium sp. W14A]|uniref:GNAT family N-acetyltransferase n=1 Tax=Caproicibacter fermentans TaxID=2576756 RepID=A0A7G8T951_9FIRM|nr:GNAT family N-acetyltransferase [Caproicibacter fermentans]OCN00993.1 GCN5 family acetyltransferase [Clostridium sp. W14A]QNK40142.1 GNAT family N-acetyltransferase [Caproicibacter fermentans]